MSIADSSTGLRRLPLIPLAEDVHFPRTELRLLVVEPAFKQWLGAVADEGDTWLGTVLLKSDPAASSALLWTGRHEIYGAGTAARLVDLHHDEHGCHLVLQGHHRFELERILPGGMWHEAWVQPVDETRVDEEDPRIRRLADDLWTTISKLQGELGPRFPLERPQLQRTRELGFETMVNHLSATLDLAPAKKLRLLRSPLPSRADLLLSILQRRRDILETLRPYRHLAPFASRH